MKYIFSGAGLRALHPFLRLRPACAFDFDGTLAPMTRDPDRARLTRSTRVLLNRLVDLYPSAIVSGRKRADVLKRVLPTRFRFVVGNHGIEWGDGTSTPIRRKVQAWLKILKPRLLCVHGLFLENKGLSLSLHYGRCPKPELALERILSAARRLPPDAKLVPGCDVINVVSNAASHKGDALRLLRHRLGERILYVGDDVTDEDVFNLKARHWLFSIRVGRSANSSARYYLKNQKEMDQLLRWLVDRARNGVKEH